MPVPVDRPPHTQDRLETLPDFVWTALSVHGVEKEAVLFAVRADRLPDGE